MNTRVWQWAFLGLPGLREVVLVALVTLLLYGRSGMQIARRGRGLYPWLSPVRRTSAARANARANPVPTSSSATTPGVSWRGDRVFWFLAILAATAVAAWIVTRTLIVGVPKVSH